MSVKTICHDIHVKEINNLSMEKSANSGSKNVTETNGFRYLQYYGAFSASMMYLLYGIHSGWSGPAIQKLHQPDSSLNLTESEDSWLTSSFTFGSIPAPILGAFGGMFLGRKRTLLLATLPILCGTVLFATANNVWLLVAGRIFCGIGIGCATPIVPLYISEISSANIRGRLVSCAMIEYNLGVLIIYAIGPYISITINSIILLLITLTFIIVFSFMPESPYFSVIENKHNLALKSLERLKVTTDNNSKLFEIQEYVNQLKEENVSYLDLFRVYSNRKALLFAVLLTTTNCLTGVNVILAYAQIIFDEIGSSIPSNYSSITFAAVGIFTVGFTSFLVDIWGRRPLLILSTFSTSVPLFLIGLFFYLKYIEFEYIDQLSLFTVISVICVKLTMSVGVTALPQVCVGEMFPTNLIAVASSFIEFYGNILRFVIIKSYRLLSSNFGNFTVFWLFCGCCIINGVIISIFFPETKNKTLEEIQKLLKLKKNKKIVAE